MMFLKILYVVYWVVLGTVIWNFEKKIANLEEENRHLKAMNDILEEGRNRQKSREKGVNLFSSRKY